MSESAEGAVLTVVVEDSSAPVPLPPDRRRLQFETAAVLCIAVLPDFFRALLFLAEPETGQGMSFRVASLMTMVRAIQVAVPVLYIMSRSGDAWSDFGIVRPRWFDPPLALGLFLLAYVLQMLSISGLGPIFEATLNIADPGGSVLEGRIDIPHGSGEYVLLGVMSLCNGFAEQLVIAGFLLPRLTVLLGHPAKAVLCAAALFGSYHIYQGALNASVIFFGGLFMGGVFVVTKRLWPLAIAHAFMDFAAFALYASQ